MGGQCSSPVAIAQLQQLQAVGGAVHLLLHCALHKHAPRILSQRQVPMLRLQQVLSIMLPSFLVTKGPQHSSYVERTSLWRVVYALPKHHAEDLSVL